MNKHKNKEQHTVPNCYLKRFATVSEYNNKQHDIFYYNKETGLSKKTSTDSGKMTEKHFYTISPQFLKNPSSIDDSLLVEGELAKIESDFILNLKYLDNVFNDNKSRSLSEIFGIRNAKIIKENISFYIGVQAMRTEVKRKDYKDSFMGLSSKIDKMFRCGDSSKLWPDMDDDRANLESSLLIFSLADIYKQLFSSEDYCWFFGVNGSKTSFYTSDNPVVIDYQDCPDRGLVSSKIHLFFPLSPKRILFIVKKKFVGENYLSWLKLNNGVLLFTEDMVEMVNKLQIRQSFRYIYSIEDNFSLARLECNRNPVLKDIHRSRIQIL
jgi:hypothetical protein